MRPRRSFSPGSMSGTRSSPAMSPKWRAETPALPFASCESCNRNVMRKDWRPQRPREVAACLSEGADLALVEVVGPADNLGVFLEQCPALALRHAAPHPVL